MRCLLPQLLSTLARDGFAVVPQVIDAAAVATLITALGNASASESVRQRSSRTYAIRNVVSLVPEIRQLAHSGAIQQLVKCVLGPRARLVRGLLFDKTPGANWKVAWHQDLSIAVRQRADVPGFGPWSTKAKVPHVQPPVAILEHMLTVRLHLDPCGPDDGPLRVIPGSHLLGVLGPRDVQRCCGCQPIACYLAAGDVLLMRPLVVHASSSARCPGHRRVIHLEYAAADLPAPLEWYEQGDVIKLA